MAAFTALALGSLLLGTATKVIGGIKSGNAAARAGEAEQAAANAQAGITDFNASVADLQAQDALDRGAQEEARFRQGVKLMMGSQRAGVAASNVDVGFGTPVDVQADTAYRGELDALTIRTNAARTAWGYNVEAADLRAGAAIQRKTGVYQAQAGYAQRSAARWSVAGSLIGAAGDASLMAARFGWGRSSLAGPAGATQVPTSSGTPFGPNA
jgi:hypothetical protein